VDNILFIMPDQLRADFLSCYGATHIVTPHIDSLCARGLRFARCLSPSPICVPARASLLTGLNPIKTGVLDNNHWLRPDRHALEITTWAEDLRSLGYQTAAIGKMHFYPWDAAEGFATRIIAEDKRHIAIQDDYSEYLREHGLRRLHGNEHDGYHENRGAVISPIPAEHQVDRWVADRTIAYLRQIDTSRPFALMVGFPGPHCPYDPPPEYANLFRPEDMPASIPATPESAGFRPQVVASNQRAWNGVDYSDFQEAHKRKLRAHYAALVKQIDDQIGRILAALRERGLLDSTLIIFASDHGDMLGDFDLIGKTYFFETSMRVPLIVAPPRMTGARTVTHTVSLTDVTATIRAAAGVTNAVGAERDSLSLLDGQPRPPIFGATHQGFMVANDTWKLCRYRDGQTMLYHRPDDPDEQHNLAERDSAAQVLRTLDALMQQEILESILFAQRDTIVEPDPLDPSSAFNQRGWQRH
jgi:arylsulfatase A-like enzyme